MLILLLVVLCVRGEHVLPNSNVSWAWKSPRVHILDSLSPLCSLSRERLTWLEEGPRHVWLSSFSCLLLNLPASGEVHSWLFFLPKRSLTEKILPLLRKSEVWEASSIKFAHMCSPKSIRTIKETFESYLPDPFIYLSIGSKLLGKNKMSFIEPSLKVHILIYQLVALINR